MSKTDNKENDVNITKDEYDRVARGYLGAKWLVLCIVLFNLVNAFIPANKEYVLIMLGGFISLFAFVLVLSEYLSPKKNLETYAFLVGFSLFSAAVAVAVISWCFEWAQYGVISL